MTLIGRSGRCNAERSAECGTEMWDDQEFFVLSSDAEHSKKLAHRERITRVIEKQLEKHNDSRMRNFQKALDSFVY